MRPKIERDSLFHRWARQQRKSFEAMIADELIGGFVVLMDGHEDPPLTIDLEGTKIAVGSAVYEMKRVRDE